MEKRNMVGRIIITVAISVLFVSLCLNAKEPPADLGYDPPEGWEFVMKLDSLSGMLLHCHNDTCLITVAFSGSREIPFFHRISYDGGENWIDIKEIYPRIFKFNSNTLHRFMVEGNQRYYEKSYDFFKTSEKYPAMNISPGVKELLESPIDTNILLTLHEGQYSDHWSSSGYMRVQISRNAGKNWELLNLFSYPKGYTLYSFNFDWAEKGHWFYKTEDDFDAGLQSYERFPDKYFETFDDGMTFREIMFDPVSDPVIRVISDIGIDGFRTFRKLNISSSSSGITKVKYYDTILSSNFINWLFIMDPTKPKSNIDSGYVRAIYDNYKFDHNNYKNHFAPLYEITNRLDENKEEINTYLYTSNNFGNDWILLNEFYKKPRYEKSYLDQGSKTIWIYLKDEEFIRGKNNSSYKGSLWKLKLPWESTSVNDISDNKSGIVIYPNPARDFITIKFQTSEVLKTSEVSIVQIFDVLGIEIMSELIHPMTASHRMNIESLSPGVYFIRIGDKVEKFVKM